VTLAERFTIGPRFLPPRWRVPFLIESVGLPGKREEIFALLAGTPEGVQTPWEERKWSSRKRWPKWRLW
jgi:hypothetical protein